MLKMRCKICKTTYKRPSLDIIRLLGFFVCGKCRNLKTGKKYKLLNKNYKKSAPILYKQSIL